MSFEELAKAVQGDLICTGPSASFAGVAIDSRTVKSNELFIAIRGERNDGHDFIEQALSKGASGVMTDGRFLQAKAYLQRTNLIVVDNTHEAMMLLAQNYRMKSKARIIGITGSNGKTTTKEFTYALLNAVEKNSYKSPGNLNNLFGAPLALFGMPAKTKAAVMEMGISTRGEMSRLTKLVRPNVAVITNVGPSHLEFLSTVEDVAQAKLEMVTASAVTIPLVINADDELLKREANKVHKSPVTFAIDSEADFKPSSIEASESGSRVTINQDSFAIEMFGRHAVYNLLAAYAAVRTLGYDFNKTDTSKIKLAAAPMRGETVNKGGVKIINDAYNANPESVKAGLEAFGNMPAAGRRLLILGDMLELGHRAEKFHRELGNLLAKYEFSFAIVIGDWSRAVLEGARQAGVSANKLRSFRNAEEAASGIGELVRPGDVVYVKGSRGVHLERIIDKIGTVGENS